MVQHAGQAGAEIEEFPMAEGTIALPLDMSREVLRSSIAIIRDWDDADRMNYELAIELFCLFAANRN